MADFWLSGAYETLGDVTQAFAHTYAALETARQNRMKGGILLCDQELGDLALKGGDVDTALQYYAAADAGWESDGNPDMRACNALNYGFTLHLAGRSDEAALTLRDAIRVLRDVQRTNAVDLAISRLGWIASDRGQHEVAIRLMAAASVVMTCWSAQRAGPEVFWQTSRLDHSRSALGEHRAQELWDQVQAMTVEACVALALLPFGVIAGVTG